MRFRALLSVAVVMAFLPTPALAQGCVPGSSNAPMLDTPDRDIYVVVDPSTCPGCSLGVHFYLYEETNNIPGLQRQDARRDDTCKDTPNEIAPDAQFSV